MDETYESNLYSHCCCCLSNSEETRLGIYVLQNKTLKTTLQTKQLTLCIICKRVAKRVEKFIRHVELNQPYFEYKKNKPDWEVCSSTENMTPVPTPQDGDNNDDFNSSFNDPEFNLFLEKELNDIIGVATTKKMCLNREIGVQVNETYFDSIKTPSNGKNTAIDIYDTTIPLENMNHEQSELQEGAINDTVIPFVNMNTDVVENINKKAHEPMEKLTKTLIHNIATPFSNISSDLEALANENSIDNIPTPYFNSIDSEIEIQDTAINVCSIAHASNGKKEATLSNKEAGNLDQQLETELNEISSYILNKGKALITEKMSKMNTQINLHVTAKAIYDPIIPYDKIEAETVPQESEKSIFNAVTSIKNVNSEVDLQENEKAIFEPVTYDINESLLAQANEKTIYDTTISLKDIERTLKVNAEKNIHKSAISHDDGQNSVLEPQENVSNNSKVISLKDITIKTYLQGKKAETLRQFEDLHQGSVSQKVAEKHFDVSFTPYEDILNAELLREDKRVYSTDKLLSLNNKNIEIDLQTNTDTIHEPATPYDDIITLESLAQGSEKNINNTVTELKNKNVENVLLSEITTTATSHDDGRNSVLEPMAKVSKAISLENINTDFDLQGNKAETLRQYDNLNTELMSQKIAHKDFNVSFTTYKDILNEDLLQGKDKCAFSTDKSLLLKHRNNENIEIDLQTNTITIHEPATPYDDIMNLESLAQGSDKNMNNTVTELKNTSIKNVSLSETAVYEPITPYEEIVSEVDVNEKAIYSSAIPLKSALTKIDALTRNEGTILHKGTDKQSKRKVIYNSPVKTANEKTETVVNKDGEISLTLNKIKETINLREENEIDIQANRKSTFKTPIVGIDVQSNEKLIFKTSTALKSIDTKLEAYAKIREKNAKSQLSKKKISTHICERGRKYFNLNFNAEIEKKIEVMKRLFAEIPEHEKIDSPIEQVIAEMRNVPTVSKTPETSKLNKVKDTSEVPLKKKVNIIEDIRICPTEFKRQNLFKTCEAKRESKIKKPRRIKETENSSEMLENVNILRIIEEMKKVSDAKPDSPMTYFRNKVIEFNRKKADLKNIFDDRQKDKVTLEVVYLTEEQCIEARKKKSEDKIYLAAKFKCENCIRGFSTKTTLDNHVATHSMNGHHECQYCKQRFESQPALKVHYKLHLRRFKCSKCEFMKSDRCVVKDHYNQQHCDGLPAYECPRCGVKYRVKHSLLKHVKSKHVNVTYPCPHCDKIYTLKQSLTVHLIGRHPNQMGLEPGKQFVCEICDQGFTSSSSLSNHRRTHDSDKEFNCVECNKLFKTKSALRKHFNSSVKHASVRFTCDYCGEKFPLKTKLLRHIYEHLGKKPHPCSVCNKGYYISSKLKDHMRTAHKGLVSPRDISCHVCHKMFQSKKILNVHLRLHTGETPYKCDKCPAKFTSTGSLSNHKKMVHLGWKRNQNKTSNQSKNQIKSISDDKNPCIKTLL